MIYHKKDIAIEQIKTSIFLFFKGKNDISVKTLIHGTRIMLEDLDRKKGVNLRLESYLNPNITKKQKKAFFDKINEFTNFCKHSDEDTKDYIDTDMNIEYANEFEIYKCIDMYAGVFDDKKEIIFILYMSYLHATGRYDFLFEIIEKTEPERYKVLVKDLNEFGLNNKNKNIKRTYYNIIRKLGILD